MVWVGDDHLNTKKINNLFMIYESSKKKKKKFREIDFRTISVKPISRNSRKTQIKISYLLFGSFE